VLMLGRRLMIALLIGAATVCGVDGVAAADDSITDTRPVATTTCGTAACQLLVRAPGQTGSKDSPSADTPTCLIVPVTELPANLAPSKAGPDAGNQIRRECFLRGRLVSSEVVYYTVEPKAPSAVDLAKQAYGKLVPPEPIVRISPASNVPQLTGLPVWLWLPSGAWVPQSSMASAGGITVKATATPQRVVWSMGDGTTVTCAGPGTPFPPHPSGDGTAPSPTCGHTFHRTSATEPGGAFRVTATIVWRVDWTGFGPGGTFPDVESSVGFPVRVIEAAALVTNSH
jgi:hypothetical protein